MSVSSSSVPISTVPSSEHTHRWRIEEQKGAKSRGVCVCGADKAFDNGWTDDWKLRPSGGAWTSRGKSGS